MKILPPQKSLSFRPEPERTRRRSGGTCFPSADPDAPVGTATPGCPAAQKYRAASLGLSRQEIGERPVCPRIPRPRIPPGRRQKPSALPSACAVGSANTKSCLRRKNFEPSGDPPAVPRQLGDWAEESRLPMLLTVCIEAGRKTLTHTSWTGLAHGSRKWMSGQAAALAAHKDRRPFANFIVASPLREPSPPSARRPPSPLDFYLSWMSPGFQRRDGCSSQRAIQFSLSEERTSSRSEQFRTDSLPPRMS